MNVVCECPLSMCTEGALWVDRWTIFTKIVAVNVPELASSRNSADEQKCGNHG